MARKKAAPSRASQTNPNATSQPAEDPGASITQSPIMEQELAISQESAIASRFELLQYNPDDLFTRKGVKLLEKMATTDDTIQFCLTALKMMALSAGYQIKAASEDPIDEQVADEVADNLENLQGSLREKLFSMMGNLDIGLSIHEKLWDVWPEGHEFAGHIRLKTLKAKNPRWFNPTVDDFNNVTGLAMISPPAYGRKLPARKFLLYSPMKRYENIWGTARTRALYDWWYLKGLAKASIAVLLQKYGKETPIGFVPPNMSPADKQSFLTALANLAHVAAATMPEGTKIEWAKFDPNSIKACMEVIEKADQQIVKVLLGQVSSSGTSHQQAGSGGAKGGNAAGGSSKGGSQEQTLEMYLEYICSDMAENCLAELIKEIVDYNYEGVVTYPKFEFKPRSEEDKTTAAQLMLQAAGVSQGGTPDAKNPDGSTTPGEQGTPLVNWTPDDEEYLREITGFPNASSKNDLRPGRKNRKAKERLLPRHPMVQPTRQPIAGYRPPTPSAPGMPANFAEDMPKPRRELSKYEKGVDFAEAWRTMDTDGEDALAPEMADILRAAVDKIKVQAKAALGNSVKIRRLTMPYREELAKALSDGLTQAAKKSMRQAKLELAKKGRPATLAEAHNLEGMAPEDVLQLIKDRSYTQAGKVSDEVLHDIQQTLYAGIKSGKSYKDVVYDIEDKIAKYVDLSQAEDMSGHRLMNIVRTSMTSVYDDARAAVFEDPALGGFVLAYQFSAVLDGDTTPWCAAMDGKIFKVTSPVWDTWAPPTWYQCRSLRVPITKADGWDGVEDDEPRTQPPDGFN